MHSHAARGQASLICIDGLSIKTPCSTPVLWKRGLGIRTNLSERFVRKVVHRPVLLPLADVGLGSKPGRPPDQLRLRLLGAAQNSGNEQLAVQRDLEELQRSVKTVVDAIKLLQSLQGQLGTNLNMV